MNRSRLLFIGFVALALGAFVSFVVYKNVLSRSSAGNEPGADVIVAANDIQVGAKLQDGDIRMVKVPASVVPPNSFRSRSQIIGRGVILPIQKGEFILPSKLAAENAGSGLPALIPPGMRAVSVRVNEVVAVAGFVIPGTRVDVLLTGNPMGANEPQTTTVLENVAVIAAGKPSEDAIGIVAVIAVRQRSDQTGPVHQAGDPREVLADSQPRYGGSNRAEFATNLGRRAGLQIKGI